MRKKTTFLILIAIYPHGQKEEDGGARQIRAKVKAQKAKREKEKVRGSWLIDRDSCFVEIAMSR